MASACATRAAGPVATPAGDAVPAVDPAAAVIDPVAGAGEPILIAEGFVYLEGPAWHPATQTLFFVDQRESKLYRLTPPAQVDVLLPDSGGSGGLALLADQSFAMVQPTVHRVSRLTVQGTLTPLADATVHGPFDRPNDITVRRDGTLYFTEPFTRQVVRITPQGDAILEWQGEKGSKPNGIGLSPDQKILYVTDTNENLVRAFDVLADGALDGERIFVTGLGMDREHLWITDGMTVDEAGNVYVASYIRPESDNPGEIAVFAPDGKPWGRIIIPRGPSNCTFGGPDNKILFVTAQGALYRLAMPIPGLRP